jgi:monoamine oxidase
VAADREAARRLRAAAALAEQRSSDTDLARMLAPSGRTDPLVALALRSGLQNEYAADPGELSAWYYDEGGTYDGDEPLVAGGFQRLADLLARGLDLRFGRRVRRIELDPRGVRVHATGGARTTADAVVLAVPAALLADGAIDLDPPLPAGVRESLDRIGTGSLEKVILRFEPGSWLPPAGTLASADPRHVERGVAEFAALPDHRGAVTLIGLVGGAAGVELARRGERAMVEAALGALRSVIGSALPEPIATTASAWSADPLARGSYTFLRPGGTPDDRAALAEVIDDRLVLAGEATDPEEPATVTGALRSGRRAARQLLDLR